MSITQGDQLLIGMGVLASVTKITEIGFDFDCINGAWRGKYNSEMKLVCVENDKEWFPANIICTKQPPEDIRRKGYNFIIPWMIENRDD